MWMGGCRNVREVLQYVVYVSNWKTIAYCISMYTRVTGQYHRAILVVIQVK